MSFKFELLNQDANCSARLGKVYTKNGLFNTPIFIPVGTQGTVKAISPRELVDGTVIDCVRQVIK